MKSKRTGISSDDCIRVLALAVVGILWWTHFIGDFVLGSVSFAGLLFVFAPIAVCWIFYAYIRSRGKPHLWLTVSMVLATLAIYPLLRQPWNPATVFYAKFESIEVGMSDEDVLRIMDGHTGGSLNRAQSIPEELRGKGVTHRRIYRHGGSDSRHDSDVIRVFLGEGVVVGTEFLPD